MLIKSFQYTGLNGFLTDKITFNKDVSFLHGINGSGKTTILRAITAILTPDLSWICTANFESLILTIQDGDKDCRIIIEKTSEDSIALSLEGSAEVRDDLSAEDINYVTSQAAHKKSSSTMRWAVRAQNFEERSFIDNNKVTSFIKKLPSPIFLGLDRTTLLSNGPAVRNLEFQLENPFAQNLRTALDDALEQAADVVLKQLAIISAERNKIYSDTQTKLILSLFDYHLNKDSKEAIDVRGIDSKAIGEFRKMQANVIAGLRKIKISNSDIERLVIPFFSEAEERASSANKALLQQMENKKETGNKKNANAEKEENALLYTALTEWFIITPYINIVRSTLDILKKANDQETKLVSTINNYKHTIDSFIGDSGKSIDLGEDHIGINLPNEKKASIRILSSGERQIFVLITHLAMNPDMQKANVLIIDEPELSLHLKWQKQFVRSVQKVSPQTQIILATHSPEIISKMTNKTIRLGL